MTESWQRSILFLYIAIASVIDPKGALAKGWAEVNFNPAKIHYQQKEFDQTLEKLNQAIEINPDLAIVYNNPTKIKRSIFEVENDDDDDYDDDYDEDDDDASTGIILAVILLIMFIVLFSIFQEGDDD